MSQKLKSQAEIDREWELIKKARVDRSAFEPLYVQNFEKVFRYVYGRIGDKEETADITSDVFAKALNKIDCYENRSVPFASWLLAIARNEILLRYRTFKRQRVINVSVEQLSDLTDENEAMGKDTLEQLTHALNQLPPEDLELIELKYFLGRRSSEIGEILGITEGSVRTRVYRVVEKLRKIVLHGK